MPNKNTKFSADDLRASRRRLAAHVLLDAAIEIMHRAAIMLDDADDGGPLVTDRFGTAISSIKDVKAAITFAECDDL